jgi:hypothetical protein
VNQQRDSYASYIGHQSLLNYMAIAENESVCRVRQQFLDVRCDYLKFRECINHVDQIPTRKNKFCAFITPMIRSLQRLQFLIVHFQQLF